MKFLILFFVCTNTFAGIGTITEQEGQVNIKRGNGNLVGTKDTSLEMLDTIITNKNKSGITFNDDTTVNVTENSKLEIDDFVYDPNSKGAGKLALKVALGTVRYASGKVAHENPNSVKINTPTATIAVRGTDFVMAVDEIGRSIVVLMPQCDDIENESCKTGSIEVITPAGSVVMNKPYQATIVESKSDAPPIPTIIKFDSSKVGNNMMVAVPKTETGSSLVERVRDVVKDSQKSKQEKSSDKNASPSIGVVGVTSEQEAQISQDTGAIGIVKQTAEKVIPSVQKSNAELLVESSHVTPVYTKVIQTGWQYYNHTETDKQQATIVMEKSTLVQIVVIQDMIQDTFQFANKPQGFITIRQNQK
jgi:FecR protein